MTLEAHPPPLSVDVAASLKLSASCLRTLGDDLFWIEGRPELDGARVVMRASVHGAAQVISPPGLSLSSRVHEYGGGALCVLATSGRATIIGVRSSDQAIVAFAPEAAEATVVACEPDTAFGDLSPGPIGCVVAVRERHLDGGVVRDIVLIELAAGRIHPLVAGRDFFSDPRVHADGRFAWCAWDHPSMPWDASEVWVARLVPAGDSFALEQPTLVAGGQGRPASSPVHRDDGSLVLVHERDDRAQLWQWSSDRGLVQVSRGSGEVGQPLWILGTTSVAIARGDGDLVCIERGGGRSVVVRLEGADLVELPCVSGSVEEIATTTSGVAVLGAGDEHLGYVAWLNDGVEGWQALGPLVPGPVSTATPVTVEADDGREVHGLLYPPRGGGERPPPVVVFCHGGPTGQALGGLNPLIEALTSRGMSVLAANYAGSTGFGASYRHRLDGRWGLADVDDCVALLSGLAERGLVDADRAAIRGTSAGGFTALLGLATGAFRGAVSWYGVADLVTLAQSTHDFEAHYLDRLVGPLPEAIAVYEQRSPVNRVGEMAGAALLLQGLDDPVVPPDQAAAMASALEANGHEVELIEFPGESHGFRRLETLVAAFGAEVSFYERHLGVAVAPDSIRSQ